MDKNGEPSKETIKAFQEGRILRKNGAGPQPSATPATMQSKGMAPPASKSHESICAESDIFNRTSAADSGQDPGIPDRPFPSLVFDFCGRSYVIGGGPGSGFGG